MGWVSVSEQQTVAARPEEVWRVLGDDFGDVHRWSGYVRSCEPLDEQPAEGAPVAGRVCEVPVMGRLEQRLVSFDAERHRLVWTTEGERLPAWTTQFRDDWSLEPIDDDRTRAIARVSVQTSFSVPVVGAAVSAIMGVTTRRGLRDLAAQVEGRPVD